ncbi:MAG TPA: NrfD/PsrC family molybdoenzyme membrane anchor subunit [Candidatus Limnocylindria bacterium]|nr:NrfD/PsrC family molybdoenzyme membrane anchor subunit [Candidatus Limnocylindria bacterium]
MTETGSRHGASYSPDDVAASLGRNDGGIGRGQTTYYDHPVLHKAHWRWEIIAYFFVGGASAASAALAALADHSGDAEAAPLVRNGRYSALAGALVSSVLLVKDLGRPERFLNMMRILKVKSPMSVGVYSLIGFSTNVGLGALDQARADGLLRGALGVDPIAWVPKSLRTAALAVSCAYMALYTGVLIAATAIPVWYVGRRHIPAIFVLSGTTTGCALQSALLAFGAPAPRTAKRLEMIELVAALAEGALLLDYERHAGETGKPLFTGPRGRRLKTWTLGLGIALPALLNLPSVLSRAPAHKPHLLRTLAASALALAGGYVLRSSLITAGRDSADDPRAYLRRPE